MECGKIQEQYKTPYFHPLPRHGNSPVMNSVGLAQLPRINVRRFYSCLHKWGMAVFVICECGEEDHTVDHVVFQCPSHQPPHRLRGLTALSDETIDRLLNTCPKI